MYYFIGTNCLINQSFTRNWHFHGLLGYVWKSLLLCPSPLFSFLWRWSLILFSWHFFSVFPFYMGTSFWKWITGHFLNMKLKLSGFFGVGYTKKTSFSGQKLYSFNLAYHRHPEIKEYIFNTCADLSFTTSSQI